MKMQNICKFSAPAAAETFRAHCFVYESDPQNLKKERILSRHRLILTVGGCGVLSLDGDCHSLQTGSLLFCFEGERFSLVEEEELSCLYVDFEGIRSGELFRRFGVEREHRCLEGFGGLIPLWRETLTRVTADTLDLAAEGILLLTFSRMAAEEKARNGIVAGILDYTEHHFDDPLLSMTHLAEHLSYNPKYLSHLFKKEMGVGYSEYLRDLRVNYARGLLDHGLDSIKNVALLSGFGDPLYFSEVFKKVVGASPKEYLRLRNERNRQEESSSSD